MEQISFLSTKQQHLYGVENLTGTAGGRNAQHCLPQELCPINISVGMLCSLKKDLCSHF